MTLRLVKPTERYPGWTVSALADDWDIHWTESNAPRTTDEERGSLGNELCSLEAALAATEARSLAEVLAKMDVLCRILEDEDSEAPETMLRLSVLQDLRRLVVEHETVTTTQR